MTEPTDLRNRVTADELRAAAFGVIGAYARWTATLGQFETRESQHGELIARSLVATMRAAADIYTSWTRDALAVNPDAINQASEAYRRAPSDADGGCEADE